MYVHEESEHRATQQSGRAAAFKTRSEAAWRLWLLLIRILEQLQGVFYLPAAYTDIMPLLD